MRAFLRTLSFGFALPAIAVACARTQPAVTLTPAAIHVRVRKGDPPDGAKDLGPITVSDGRRCEGHVLGTYKRALIRLRNGAAHMGGDYVQIMTITEPHREPYCYDYRFTIRGMVYRLPAAAPVEADDTEAAEDACDPPCSPGYECDSEVCQPVCNPPCSGDQVCRQDRTCGPAGDGASNP